MNSKTHKQNECCPTAKFELTHHPHDTMECGRVFTLAVMAQDIVYGIIRREPDSELPFAAGCKFRRRDRSASRQESLVLMHGDLCDPATGKTIVPILHSAEWQLRIQINELHDQGLGAVRIARQVGMPVPTVSNWIREFEYMVAD